MKELFNNTFSYLDGGVRIFLLIGEEKALVVDTGMSGIDVKSLVSKHSGLPVELLCTHADRDHIGSNAQFEKLYMHPSEAAFYKNVQNGSGRIIPVFGGDVIDLGGRELEIVHLPGHTPGSITVLDRINRCLIGGDPIQEDGNIFMFGDQRSFPAYIASLKRLCERDGFDFIYPSHAKEKVGRGVIPQLADCAERLVSGELCGEEKEMFNKKIRVCDAGVSRFLCEPGQDG